MYTVAQILNIQTELVEISILVVVLLFMLISSIYGYHRRKNRSTNTANAPILMAYYTLGAQELLHLAQGTIGKLPYTALLALGNQDGVFESGRAIIYRVELPFTTKLHLLGIPKRSGATQLNPAYGNGIMERVSLEGDYDNYFTLYAEKNMQTQSRYALDPKAMVFTVDFCQAHNWEIINDELYFVSSSKMRNKDDPTYMHSDVHNFVEEIRPAIELPAKHHIKKRHFYNGMGLFKPYNCPVCSKKMTIEGNVQRCPNQHGLLLKGSLLPQLKTGAISNPSFSKDSKRQSQLQCPVCSQAMVHVAYNGSKTVIDSCTNCPYRWLDPGELTPKA